MPSLSVLVSVLVNKFTDFAVGLFITVAGLHHIFFAGSSMLADLGLPVVLAFLGGLLALPTGLLYLARALIPGTIR